MDEKQRYEAGMQVRRAVLGDAHVDRSLQNRTAFNEEFQEMITRHAWGDIWTRPGLPRHTRSLVTIAMLIGMNREGELKLHLRAARNNGVSREEIKEDLRQSEGDPHIKARQRQLRLQRAKRRMMQNVPKATVVIANPTHFAVALRYDTSEAPAPVFVAKGMDSLALKIREVAEAYNVPVIEDPPLARALYAAVDMEQVIPQQHYEAVAKIIGFILGAGRKAARRARV